MSIKPFIFSQIRVFFKHTDYTGVVHPYNYFEWTSYVREAFFQETVKNFKDVLDRPIKMMTAKIIGEYISNALFGDHIIAVLSVGRIKKVSFDMIITFMDEKKEKDFFKTTHTVVFVDSRTGKFSHIPNEMMEVIPNYAMNYGQKIT